MKIHRFLWIFPAVPLVALVAWGAVATRHSGPKVPAEQVVVVPFAHPSTVRHAVLGPGEVLSQLLAALGASPREASGWVAAAAPHLNLRSLPVGLEGHASLDHHGELFAVTLVPDWQWEVVLERDGGTGGIVVERRQRPVERDLWVVRGEVRSSLFEAVLGSGETENLAVALADVFQWDIDFHREVRQGDTFAVVVERVQSGGRTKAYGPILAATYTNRGRTFSAVRFAMDGAVAGYYDADGRPLRKRFLRAPLRFSRISSRFSTSRLHPVLGRRIPHWGVDYAAPTGTPVMATGDGTVITRGWKGGGGNTVEIRHPGGYVTGYLHLSRFGQGVAVGSRVRQGQVIGFVGSTGLSTGPHLDYRVAHNGRYINPLTLGRDPAPPLPATELPRFSAWSEQVTALLENPGGVPEDTVVALKETAPVRFDV